MIGYDSLAGSITIADIHDNTYLDLLVANNGTNNIGMFFDYGNETFTYQKTFSTGSDSHPCSIAVSDMNNDNQSDLIIANYGINQIGIFFGIW